jgi:cytochrome bd ubiquinol oxidase subunit II
MALHDVWFLLIAVLWTGYFVLEGFDFGVGMLLPVLGRDDLSRRVMINTIGPVWDGNEVWLLTAGGATFAAFPDWYASLFSGFYLPLLLILLALIVRGVAFEYRGKHDSERWRANFDTLIVAGSLIPAVLWGVAFGAILHGVPLDSRHEFHGTMLDLLTPYSLLGGLVTLLVFLTYGALFLGLKTLGPVREAANRLARTLGPAALVAAGGFLLWTQLAHGKGWTWAAVAVAAVALAGGLLANRLGREGWAMVGVGVAIAATTTTLFGSLYPRVLPSSTRSAWSLTVHNASSSPYTLRVMTWVAVVFTPVVLAYQAWTYWVFRRRVAGPRSAPAGTVRP